MEVINKKHENIFVNDRLFLAAYVKFASTKTIYFSAGAAREFRMKAGLKLNFINDDGLWLFYLDNSSDGFDLIEREDKNAVLICNSALIELFTKRTRCKIPCKFPLIRTLSQIDGHDIIKIDLTKPME